jgi:hypothetical protein
VPKEGKPKGVNSQMPFNTVGGFVETKTFRLHLALQVFFTAWESMMIKAVQCVFLPETPPS